MTTAGSATAPTNGNRPTLPQLLLRNVERFGDQVAMREKEFGIWQSLSWRAYAKRVQNFSLGLREMGLERGERVAIVGDNRPEWLIAEMATQAAGAISMGVYQDAVAAEVQFLVAFSGARIVVAEDQEQVDKLLEVKDDLPTVEKIIYYDPRGLLSYTQKFLVSFEEVEKLGEGSDESSFRKRVAEGNPEDIALLSTTSGTTGKPKLAMLTHNNMVSMAEKLQEADPMAPGDEFVSFLPLAWIGEQMTTVACGTLVGFTANFPEEPETVQENIKEIGPQMMFSPPRIWENMVSEVQVKIEDSSWLKRKIFEWAMTVGYRYADATLNASMTDAAESGSQTKLPASLRLQRFVAEWTCFVWLKDKLGLRRLKRAYTGGAALGPDIFRFFHALGVNLKQIYGQTEVSGISCIHRDGSIRFQTVGTPLGGTEIEIAENGEILAKSEAVFIGYFKNEEATAETLQDGWLHSGDAGYFDDEGHLIVIDRAKDVMTLQDGTRFSPQFIENKLKFSPYIKEAVVFGGGSWPTVTSMITIDFSNTGKWAERRQIPYTTFTDLAQKPEVYELVVEHVRRTNEDLPNAARIKRFLLLHKEFDADDAELTRTRKVRRNFVAERYKELVDALYSDASSVAIRTEISYQDGSTATLDTSLKVANP